MVVKLKQKPSGRVIGFKFEHARRLLVRSKGNNYATYELADDKYIFQGNSLILKPETPKQNDTANQSINQVSGEAKKSGQVKKGGKSRTKAKSA